jgi:hypothetical protein
LNPIWRISPQWSDRSQAGGCGEKLWRAFCKAILSASFWAGGDDRP